MPNENEINDTETTEGETTEVDTPELGMNTDLVNWATKVLNQADAKEMQEIKLQILRRIAAESDIKPARIPAPMNITEIGGYFNLMMKLKKEEEKTQQKAYTEMLRQTLTSILGLPMQAPN